MEVPHKKNPMVWGMYPYFRKPPFDKIMTSEATGYTLSSRVSGCCTATATACDVLGISLFFITCSTIFCNMSDTLSKDCIHLRTFFTAKTLSKYYCIYWRILRHRNSTFFYNMPHWPQLLRNVSGTLWIKYCITYQTITTKAKKQKTHEFFLFFWDIVDSMYAKNKNSSFFCFWLLKPYQTITTKEKHLEFFCFLRYWLIVCMQKNSRLAVEINQKQTKPRENKKKIFWVKTKHSPQSFVFLVSQASPRLLALFFLFSKVFAVLVILDIYILYKISEALMFT